MPIQKNLNVSPYYDDFNPDKNYYQVLYKAGYPVQARELTQQQSILKDQIEQFASRILKEGDNVVPGEFTYLARTAYVRLSSFTRGAKISDFQDQILQLSQQAMVQALMFKLTERGFEQCVAKPSSSLSSYQVK